METLITERLVLRPFRNEDLEDFYEYARNPNVAQMRVGSPMKARKNHVRYLKGL